MEEGMGALIWFYTSPNGPEEVLAMITVAHLVLLLGERLPRNCCRLEAATSGSEGADMLPPRGRRLAGLGFPVRCRSHHATGCSVRSEVFLLPRLPEPSPTARQGGCSGRQVGAPHRPELRVRLFLPNVNVVQIGTSCSARKTEVRFQVRSGILIQNKCRRPQYVWYVQYSFEA